LQKINLLCILELLVLLQPEQRCIMKGSQTITVFSYRIIIRFSNLLRFLRRSYRLLHRQRLQFPVLA